MKMPIDFLHKAQPQRTISSIYPWDLSLKQLMTMQSLVNTSTLHGNPTVHCYFQALLTLLTVLCVVFDAAGNLWKYKVESSTRSIHEIIYRYYTFLLVCWPMLCITQRQCDESYLLIRAFLLRP